jgi:ABC-2 type transport system permease protein
MNTQSKSVVSQDLILAARQGLIPVRDHALGGFGNMLRKELGQWWGTRTWWVQTLIWMLILNGISTIVALTEGGTPAEKLQVVVQTFLPMAVMAVAIGTVIAAQGAIVGEKELGTAAWVMSKPASRSGFILAKLVSLTQGFWITALIIPAAVFVITTRLLIPAPLALPSFLAGLAVAMLSQLFFVALSLMLGTFFNSRGPIAAIGIAVIIAGMLLKGFIPLVIQIFTPFPLGDISAGLALRMPLPSVWWVPIVVVSAWIIVMTAVALRRFQREEF